MVNFYLNNLEKRAFTNNVQQSINSDIKNSYSLLVDGLCILWRYLTIRADRRESIFVGKKEPFQHFQVLHKCVGNADYFTDFVLDVNAAEKEQILSAISYQYDSQKGC